MEDGKVIISAELDTKDFDKQIKSIEFEMERLEYELEAIKESDPYEDQEKDIVEYEEKIEKLGNRLVDLKKKQEDYNQSIEDMSRTDLMNIQEQLGGIGRSVEGITKKVSRWALGIFGIRGAYMMVRNAMNIITSQDKQLAYDIQYIKTALAYSLEPIVRAIVNLMKQILYYVAYIIKAVTGNDIFAKTNKSLKNATGNAKALNKELEKTLAGFDEMNILQDTSSTAGADGMAGYKMPDLKTLSWLDGWIKRNKKNLISILGGIAGAVLAIKNGWGIIKALGIGIAIAGILDAIQNLIDFIKDPSFENFTGILEGIATAIIGIGIVTGNLPLIIAGVIALIVTEIVKNIDKIKEFFDNLLIWMRTKFLDKLIEWFGSIGYLIYAPFEAGIKAIKTIFEGFYGGIKKIIDGIVDIFKGNFIEGIKKIFSGLKDILLAPFYAMRDIVKTIFTNVVNFFIDVINTLIRIINKLPGVNIKEIKKIGAVSSASYGGGGTMGGRAKGGIFYPSKLPKLALGGIINNPGPGVAYHGAYIGERGAEAVVPLTDSEQMTLLGETIGRYITVNATIPVYAYNREVDRQIQIIRAENNFASNR